MTARWWNAIFRFFSSAVIAGRREWKRNLLELLELLLCGGTLCHFDDVKTNGFGQRAALADRHGVT